MEIDGGSKRIVLITQTVLDCRVPGGVSRDSMGGVPDTFQAGRPLQNAVFYNSFCMSGALFIDETVARK